jgi:hypothetical protein
MIRTVPGNSMVFEAGILDRDGNYLLRKHTLARQSEADETAD